MPRIPRKSHQCNFFHVMIQGINKEKIFDDTKLMSLYLEIIEKNLEKYNVDILSYCVMSNHVHLLIYAEPVDEMIGFFRCVNTSYAKIYNSRCKRVGYVFRDRYKSKEINSMAQLIDTIIYIHNNPVKAEICSTPDLYSFSSYNEFFGKNRIVNKKFLYKLFRKIDIDEIFKFEKKEGRGRT